MKEYLIPLGDSNNIFYFVQGKNNAYYPFSNSLLIGTYLIDTGISPRIIRDLKKRFSIKTVINSHWHEDHISGNYLFENAIFMCRGEDKKLIENIKLMEDYYGVKGTKSGKDFMDLMNSYKLKDTKIEKVIHKDIIIEIDGGFKLRVVHTPGHTAGHCIFQELNAKVAFLGDIDMTKFPYYGNTDANLTDFYESIDKVMNLDIELAMSGHKGIVEGKSEIRDLLKRFKLSIDKRSERILSNMPEKKPVLPDSLRNLNLIYKKYSEFKDFELISEVLMIQKHFDYFLSNGILSKEETGYVSN